MNRTENRPSRLQDFEVLRTNFLGKTCETVWSESICKMHLVHRVWTRYELGRCQKAKQLASSSESGDREAIQQRERERESSSVLAPSSKRSP